MKKAFLVYFADKSANVVICQSLMDIDLILGADRFSQIVKIELIPFEVL